MCAIIELLSGLLALFREYKQLLRCERVESDAFQKEAREAAADFC